MCSLAVRQKSETVHSAIDTETKDVLRYFPDTFTGTVRCDTRNGLYTDIVLRSGRMGKLDSLEMLSSLLLHFSPKLLPLRVSRLFKKNRTIRP